MILFAIQPAAQLSAEVAISGFAFWPPTLADALLDGDR